MNYLECYGMIKRAWTGLGSADAKQSLPYKHSVNGIRQSVFHSPSGSTSNSNPPDVTYNNTPTYGKPVWSGGKKTVVTKAPKPVTVPFDEAYEQVQRNRQVKQQPVNNVMQQQQQDDTVY